MNKGTDAHSSKTETPFEELVRSVANIALQPKAHLHFTAKEIAEAILENHNQEVRQVLEGLKAGYILATSSFHGMQTPEPMVPLEAIDSLLERYSK